MNNKIYKYSLFSILAFCVFLLSKDIGIFWDNVLFVSKMGNHLFENGLFHWRFPSHFDPGHPPFIGFIQALGWKLLGKKLWVAHFIMIPFVIGFFIQLYRFITYFITGPGNQFLVFLLILVDPTLSAQLMHVSPEVSLLFFLLLALNGLLLERRWQMILGLMLLSIVSYRGMLLSAGVFIFHMLYLSIIQRKTRQVILKRERLSAYFLASIPAITYILWRKLGVGWIMTHPDSPWSSLAQWATFKMFLRNGAVLAHQYLDFGRVMILIPIVVILFLKWKTNKTLHSLKSNLSKKQRILLLLSISLVSLIILVSLIMQNQFGHRYFIPSYIMLSILFYKLIETSKWKNVLLGIGFITLSTGNLWIYPRDIAQGWDATLASAPYTSLRREAIQYIDKSNIKINAVSSFYPNIGPIGWTDLSDDQRQFASFQEGDLYVLYADVYNLSDDTYHILDTQYKRLKTFRKRGVEVIIYIKKVP